MTHRTAQLWTLGCLLLSGVALGVNLWASPASAAPQPAGQGPLDVGAATIERRVTVASTVGEVQVRRDGGPWVQLERGRELERGDEIRTGAFSEVVVRDLSGSTLTLTPNTTFTVGEDTAEVSRFTLGVGKVAAEIRRERDRTYEFEAAAGDAKAGTQGGEFSLSSDGRGLLGVVTRKGEVALSSQGKSVRVTAGKQAVALPGEAPGDPLPIPQEVFLQVRWPDKATEAKEVVLVGKTDRGARILAAGHEIPVGADGMFELKMPLAEGENRLVVVAEDPAGNVRRNVSPPIVRESRTPALKVKVRGNLWGP